MASSPSSRARKAAPWAPWRRMIGATSRSFLLMRRASGSTEATDEGINGLILKMSVFSDALHDVKTVGDWHDIRPRRRARDRGAPRQ